MSTSTFKLSHASEDELTRKLIIVMQRRGYRVERANPERISVGQLSKRVGRPLSTVSRSLRRPSCPPYVAGRGKTRLLWVEVTAGLLAYLRDWRKGQRSTT